MHLNRLAGIMALLALASCDARPQQSSAEFLGGLDQPPGRAVQPGRHVGHHPQAAGQRVDDGAVRFPTLEFAIDGQGSVWFAMNDRYQVWRRTLEGDTLLTFSFPAETLMDVSLGEPFPVVDRMLTDEAGYVYVFPQAKDVQEAGTAVDVFDSTGVFLARVLLPVKVQRRQLLVRRGALYGVMRDSLDVPYVVRLRLGLES